jgi:hypothetical protein
MGTLEHRVAMFVRSGWRTRAGALKGGCGEKKKPMGVREWPARAMEMLLQRSIETSSGMMQKREVYDIRDRQNAFMTLMRMANLHLMRDM